MPPRRSETGSFPLQTVGDDSARAWDSGETVLQEPGRSVRASVPLLYRQAAFEMRKMFQRVYCSIGTPSYIWSTRMIWVSRL